MTTNASGDGGQAPMPAAAPQSGSEQGVFLKRMGAVLLLVGLCWAISALADSIWLITPENFEKISWKTLGKIAVTGLLMLAAARFVWVWGVERGLWKPGRERRPASVRGFREWERGKEVKIPAPLWLIIPVFLIGLGAFACAGFVQWKTSLDERFVTLSSNWRPNPPQSTTPSVQVAHNGNGNGQWPINHPQAPLPVATNQYGLSLVYFVTNMTVTADRPSDSIRVVAPADAEWEDNPNVVAYLNEIELTAAHTERTLSIGYFKFRARTNSATMWFAVGKR